MTQLVGTYGARSTESLLRLLGGSAARECDLLEIRLDFLADASSRVAEIIRAAPRPVLATCRRAGEGGALAGSDESRLDLLARAADAGAAWVDVEDDVPLESVRRLSGRGARVLRSLHTPRLPERADELVARLLDPPADAAKLVLLSGNARDVVTVLDLVRRHGERLAAHVSDCAFSRYAGAATGSLFTYASLQPGGLIPARIPTVRTTRGRMRFERLARGAPLFVLLGADVERSVSPDMLNAAFDAGERPEVALRWSCDDPAPALEAILRFRWTGAAVTIPHKERVFELIRARGARLAPSAQETGAVNSVLREGEVLVAHNTDVDGVLGAIRAASPQDLAGKNALVLGAGGAARAAVRAAIALDCGSVAVHARRADAAERLTSLRSAADPVIRVAVTSRDAARSAPSLVLQATPAGSAGDAPVFEFASLPQPAVVLEMIVSATPTANESAASAAGHRVVRGLDMLAHQAAAQVGLLTGTPADAATLRAAGAAWLERGDRPIVLVGLRCSGKTETGLRLARLLGRPFVDSDHEVESLTGRSPDAMIRGGDEPAFREAEADVLRRLLTRRGAVVALGGGAALHATLLEELAAAAHLVHLDADDTMLLARWSAAPRAALTALPPRVELDRQRAERSPLYRRLAHRSLDTSALSPDEVAEALAGELD